MTQHFDFLATGIGSLPLTDADAAVELALRYLPEAPIWPQLPRRGFREHMGAQYSEGLPGLVLDEARERFWLDSSRDLTPELERFFERYLARDLGFFALSESHAAGFHAFERALERGLPPGVRFLKGHVTGPLTAGLSCKDEQGRDIVHNELLYDAVVKSLAPARTPPEGRWCGFLRRGSRGRRRPGPGPPGRRRHRCRCHSRWGRPHGRSSRRRGRPG